MHLPRRTILAAATLFAFAGCGGFGGAATGPECVGLSPERCRALSQEALEGLPPGTPVRSVQTRCTVAACTEVEGEAETTLILGDGQRMTSRQGWAAAPALAPGVVAPAPVPAQPAPDLPLPVVPVCQGVPAEKCLEFARSGARDLGLGGPVITRIVVRCAAQCTATKGEGSTDLTFADGTTLSTGWGYESIGG